MDYDIKNIYLKFTMFFFEFQINKDAFFLNNLLRDSKYDTLVYISNFSEKKIFMKKILKTL